jgi:hypothetical protein
MYPLNILQGLPFSDNMWKRSITRYINLSNIHVNYQKDRALHWGWIRLTLKMEAERSSEKFLIHLQIYTVPHPRRLQPEHRRLWTPHSTPHQTILYHTIQYYTIPYHTFIPYLSLSALNMILTDSNFRDQQLILPWPQPYLMETNEKHMHGLNSFYPINISHTCHTLKVARYVFRASHVFGKFSCNVVAKSSE